MEKPRIFIASSTEYVKYAHAVHKYINNRYAYSKLWETAIEPGEYTLPALYEQFHKYNYGIFVFSPDDIINIRNNEFHTVRDNVLFEFGMFIGINGLENAFILSPENYFDGGRIPSDLYGITIATFDGRREDDELIDAISSTCLIILDKIKKVEQRKLSQSSPGPNSPFVNILTYEGEMFSSLIDMLSNAQKEIVFVISSNERRIVFDLFISIFYARLDNIEITVHYYPLVNEHVNSYSIEIFSQLGCHCKSYPPGIAPPRICMISDPDNTDYSKMIVKTDQYNRKNVFAFVYSGSIHNATIKSFVDNLELVEKQEDYMPSIERVGIDILKEAFQKVPIYKENSCEIELVKIKPSITYPQTGNLVREYKIKQILLLDSIYTENKFDLFEPTAVILKNGIRHLIVPPIIEDHNSQNLIAEGHTRLFMYKESDRPIYCIKVLGMKTPLPSSPSTWQETDVAPYGVVREFIPDETYLSRIRKAEKYLHKGDWYNDIKPFN